MGHLRISMLAVFLLGFFDNNLKIVFDASRPFLIIALKLILSVDILD